MLKQRPANIVFAIFLLFACGYFINAAMGFNDLSLPGSNQLSSRFFPITILLFIAGCILIVLGQYVLKKGSGLNEEESIYEGMGQAVHGTLTIVAVIAAYLIWDHVGFVPAALFIGPAAALAMGVRSWKICVILIVISLVIYFAFSQLLGIQLK
jgi:uncharacterized membrane protein